MNLRGPPLLALVEIRSGAEHLDFPMGAHALYTERQMHREKRNPKKTPRSQKMFPVKEVGCATKSPNDLPVIQLLQREANELYIISVTPRKSGSSLESVICCRLVTFGIAFWNIKVRNSLLRVFYRSLRATESPFFLIVSELVCVLKTGWTVMATHTRWEKEA